MFFKKNHLFSFKKIEHVSIRFTDYQKNRIRKQCD
jgi:hypothetical protein